MKTAKSFWALLVLVIVLFGCSSGLIDKEPLPKGVTSRRFYWCVEQINTGTIHKQMDLRELRTIFGTTLSDEALNQYGQHCVFSILDDLRSVSDKNPVQLGPVWIIEFSIGENNLVTDFTITKTGEK